MAQKLRDDKIGTLSHSAGAITLTASSSNPSWLTIGGQQYRVTSNLSRTIATDLTMTANSLYMIYAVRNAGNTELRISANVNSVGPAGFVSWLLVGAFYSNGLVSVGFGSFVTIFGSPTSNTWDAGVIPFFSNAVAVTKGTVDTDRCSILRNGDMMEFSFNFDKDVVNGSAVAGAYSVRPPSVFSIDNSKMNVNGNENFRCRGSGHLTTAADGRILVFNYGGSNEFTFQYANGATNSAASTASHPFAAGAFYFSGIFKVPIIGWSNTPLKDL